MMQPPSSIELNFSPSQALISDVRRFVSVFYRRAVADADAADRAALATHELLENAAKYAVDEKVFMRLEVVPVDDGLTLQVLVNNRAAQVELQRVQQRFDEMQAAGDPAEHYYALLRRPRAVDGRAGLGLARVQAEAEMALALQIDVDQVSIRGTTHVDTQRGGQERPAARGHKEALR